MDENFDPMTGKPYGDIKIDPMMGVPYNETISEKIISTAKRVAVELQNKPIDADFGGWIFFTSTIRHMEGDDSSESWQRNRAWEYVRKDETRYVLRKDGKIFIHKSEETSDWKYGRDVKNPPKIERKDLGVTELVISNLDSDYSVHDAVEYLDFEMSNWSYEEGTQWNRRYYFSHPKDYLMRIPGNKLNDLSSCPFGLRKYVEAYHATRKFAPDKPLGQGMLEMLEALPEEVAKKLEAARQQELAQQQKWEQQGMCRYCGGKLAFLTRKCKNCNKKN